MNRSYQERLLATAFAVSLASGASCLPSGAAEKNPLRLVSGARAERMLEGMPARVSDMAGHLVSIFSGHGPSEVPAPGIPVPSPKPERIVSDDDILRTALVQIGRRNDPFDYVLKDQPKNFGQDTGMVVTVRPLVAAAPVVSLDDAMGALIETTADAPSGHAVSASALAIGTTNRVSKTPRWILDADPARLEAMLVDPADRLSMPTRVEPAAVAGSGLNAKEVAVVPAFGREPDPARFGWRPALASSDLGTLSGKTKRLRRKSPEASSIVDPVGSV
jgi:hypothetical protein